uniref:GIY-YIG domain-containing protein n=1 Tax=viral metagenome TaxID=1070528 RepID=A0A6C0ELY7_9ZZZZ
MGYEHSKIYKLLCDDGHYYYGSTIAQLKSRYWGHKDSSKTMTSRLYTHINSIGWDKVKIELVEAFSCANRTEIRMKENEYISASKDDPLCLNTLPAYASDDQKQQRVVTYYETNKQTILERNRDYVEKHKEAVAEKHKEYYEKNKEKIQAKHDEYIAKNADTIKAQRREFYQQNKERLCAEKRARRAADPEAVRMKTKEYRDKNRERINAQKRKNKHGEK